MCRDLKRNGKGVGPAWHPGTDLKASRRLLGLGVVSLRLPPLARFKETIFGERMLQEFFKQN